MVCMVFSNAGRGSQASCLQALSDGGVRAGLPRDVALQLAAQTGAGARLGRAALASCRLKQPRASTDRALDPACSAGVGKDGVGDGQAPRCAQGRRHIPR